MFFLKGLTKSVVCSPSRDSVVPAVRQGTVCSDLIRHHRLLLCELEKLGVVGPESSSSGTEPIPAFSFQRCFTTTSARDVAKSIIHGCAGQFVYFVWYTPGYGCSTTAKPWCKKYPPAPKCWAAPCLVKTGTLNFSWTDSNERL